MLVGIVGLAIPASAGAAMITAWSFQGGASVSPLKLKVARPAGGDLFTIVGQDELRTPTANVLNTYPVRIPVQAGDVIGETNTADYKCQREAPGYAYHFLAADPAVGSVEAYDSGGLGQLDLSARLEPDADNDGFGDETQDCDPADPSRAEDCAAPSATITSGPKNKTKKKRAKFEFTGTDTRAVASFECKLDSNLGFSPCTSPVTVKVKKGKHTFQVRAVDQAGNVGAPASDTWKRKRKKK